MIEIAGRKIATGLKPYIVAEISCSHAGKLENAIRLINVARHSGADAVKFQAYTADTITIDHKGSDFIIQDGPWAGENIYQLYKRTETPFEWFPHLFDEGKRIGITVFASVFDESSVDMLEKLDCPAYKIASAEIRDTPLIGYAAKTKKPIIISMGMASSFDVLEADDVVWEVQNRGPLFLHCVSGYPTNVKDANLHVLRQNRTLGISDHSTNRIVPIAATAMGAVLIEKHIKLSDVPTEDAEFSLNPWQFQEMVTDVTDTWSALHRDDLVDHEAATKQMRRSIYAVKDIDCGEPFTKDNVRSIRPAYGLHPNNMDILLTKRANRFIPRGSAMKPEYIK